MLLDRKCSGSIYSYVYSIGMKAVQVLIFTYKIPYLYIILILPNLQFQ